jgi:hypothetical protein
MSRVIKVGQLDNEKIIAAIQSPAYVQIRGNRYTFTNFQRFGTESDTKGVFARLAKYKPEGAVEVVQPETHAVALEEIENLIEASSPFVYLPEFSGIAYKHVWNTLPRERFERAFCEIIEAKYHGFFVRCELEAITDLRTFVARLARLDRVTELQATVKPPNPLFGPCWRSLNEYIKKRQLEEVKIKEESPSGILTNITQIALAVDSSNVPADSLHQMMEPLLEGVGDAALLMAADGYGSGKVVGLEQGRTITIRTSENQKSFLHTKEPTPEELFNVALEEFAKLTDDRQLDHT